METNKKAIFVPVFLALICIILLGYIIYFKINKLEDNDIPTNNEETKEVGNEITNEEEPEEVIEITETDVMNLYDLIGNYQKLRSEKVLFTDLYEAIKDQMVLKYLNVTCAETINISKQQFLEAYYAVFNQNKVMDDGICTLNDDTYQCQVLCEDEYVKIIKKFERYEVVDEQIVIYEKAGHLEYHDDGNIYLRSTDDSLDSIRTYAAFAEIKLEEIVSELSTYKHTFKLNENNYYWFSSELIKQ